MNDEKGKWFYFHYDKNMKSSSRKKRLFFCLVKVTFKEKEKWDNSSYFSWDEVSLKKKKEGKWMYSFHW